MLRSLMASRGAPALLRGRTVDREGSDREVPYRATAFWQAKPGGERIYPFLRCDYGELEVESTSALSFARGEPFAGQAWELLDASAEPIGAMCMESQIASLKDCATPPHSPEGAFERWQQGWQQLRVPEPILLKMGKSTGYATRVRSLACVAVRTVYGDIVFCIESVRPDGFSEEMLLESAVEHAKAAAARRRSDRSGEATLTDPFEICCRSLLYAHVIDHQDFWTWLLRAASPFRRVVGTALVGPLCLAAKLIWEEFRDPSKLTNEVLVRLVQIPNLVISVSLLVLVLIGGFGLVPDAIDISKYADERVRSRLELFCSRLFQAYVLACVFLMLMLAHGLLPGKNYASGLELLAILASVGSSYSAVAAFFSIARAGASPLGVTTRVPRYAATAMLVVAFVAAAGVLYAAPPNEDGSFSATGRCLVAGAAGLSLCLLVSRLDSRLVGVPGILVAALYVNALAHTVGCLLFTFAAVVDPIAPALQVPLAVASSMRLPLDVLLFTVTLWAVRGRALERYLNFLAELAPQVPRSVFRWSAPFKTKAD